MNGKQGKLVNNKRFSSFLANDLKSKNQVQNFSTQTESFDKTWHEALSQSQLKVYFVYT